MLKKLMSISSNPKILCVLEGGYNLDSIANAVTHVVKTLIDKNSVLNDE